MVATGVLKHISFYNVSIVECPSNRLACGNNIVSPYNSELPRVFLRVEHGKCADSAAQDGHPPGRFLAAGKVLLRDSLIGKDSTFFDYGCGRGEDIELLSAEGVVCGGW